jgi:hypothetical protein
MQGEERARKEQAMKQVIHIFRKDVRHLWKEIAASLAVLAIYTWSEPATWVSGAAASGLTTRSSIAEWLILWLPVSWWLLVVRVVQSEPLVGDRQFWVTRPYEWKKLLAAKVLFIAALVNFPLLLAQLSLLWLAGFPPSWAHLPGILWMQLMWALVMLGFAALAAVTTGIGQMTLVMLGIWVYVALSGSYYSPSFSQRVSHADGIPQALAFAVPLGMCAGITVWQYARRRTAQARMAFVGAALTPFLISAATPHRFLVNRAYPELASGQLAPVQLSFVPINTTTPRSVFSQAPNRDKKTLIVLQPELHATGMAARSMVVTNGNRVEIEGPNGFRWDSGWGWDRTQFHDQAYFRYTVMLEPALYERIKDIPVKLRISFAVADFDTRETHDVVVSEDEFAVKNLGLCAFTKSNWSIECRYALRRPGYIAAASATQSTCPGVDRSQPSVIAKTEVWQPAYESGPAEFGISPVQTINTSMTIANKPLLCPGTLVTFTFPKETGRARISVETDGIRLSDYRQSDGAFVPPGMVTYR